MGNDGFLARAGGPPVRQCAMASRIGKWPPGRKAVQAPWPGPVLPEIAGAGGPDTASPVAGRLNQQDEPR